MDDQLPVVNKLVLSHWNLLSINNRPEKWLMKICCQKKSYQIALSDLSSIFVETMTFEEIENRCKEMNKRLEAPTEKVVDHIHQTLSQHCDYNLIVDTISVAEVCLSFSNSFYSGMPFHWKFSCKQPSTSHGESLCRKLLFNPLLLSVSHLMCENKKLQEIICRKDDEIKDYRDSGYKVSRPHLRTEIFDRNLFEANLIEDKAYAVAITKDPFSIISEKSVNDIMVSSSSNSSSSVPASVLKSSPSKDSASQGTISSTQSPIRKRGKRKPRPAVRGCVLNDVDDGDEDPVRKVVKPLPLEQTSKPKKTKKKKIF